MKATFSSACVIAAALDWRRVQTDREEGSRFVQRIRAEKNLKKAVDEFLEEKADESEQVPESLPLQA